MPAALSLLVQRDDFMFSHHRSHGYYFAKGAPLEQLFAEIYGKATGANGGRAGSQDISHSESKFYSGAILGGAVSIAVGAAFASPAPEIHPNRNFGIRRGSDRRRSDLGSHELCRKAEAANSVRR